MTAQETAIAERLRAAADRISINADIDRVIEREHVVGLSARANNRLGARVALAAACLLAVAGAAALAMWSSDETIEAAQDSVPTEVPAGAPKPGSVAPHAEMPPSWVGALQPGRRQGGFRDGRWVGMAIGRQSPGVISDPIVISVFDGSFAGLDDAETVVISQTLQSIEFPNWQAIFTIGTPSLMVGGSVDEALLDEVLRATTITTSDRPEDVSLLLGQLPAGYSEIVAPQILAEDPKDRRTLANETGDVSINEVSDWVDPLLYALSTGAEITSVAVGEQTGWTGSTESNPFGPLTFLVWAPQPGVLLEVVTTDTTRTLDELVQLATATRPIPVAEWDTRYQD